MDMRRLLLGAFALGLVSVLACGVDRERNLDSVVSDSGYSDVGVDSGRDLGFDDSSVDAETDVESCCQPDELCAVACPDEQEEEGGPYRINDINDEYDGWCLYVARVREWIRIDDCRSYAPEGREIVRYIFRAQGTGGSDLRRCDHTENNFISSGIYEGSLTIIDNQEGEDTDLILFKIHE